MAKKLYDLAVKTGEYTNQQGEQKGRWQNVGAVLQGDDGGKFVMLAKWFNPAGVPDINGRGGESLLLSMFPPKDQQQANQAPPQHAPQQQYNQTPQNSSNGSPNGDDIPF